MIASSFHVALGDLPTWLLAVFALGALIAAGLAYGEQRKALADQRNSTGELAKQATALADQVAEQRKANALQAKVVEQQLGVLVRQQAELIGLEHSTYEGTPTGLNADAYHSADVTNGSGRPVRKVVCRLQTQQGGATHPARNVGTPVVFPAPKEMGERPWTEFDLWHHDDKIRLLRQGETWVFVFPVVADSQAILTLRFTMTPGCTGRLTTISTWSRSTRATGDQPSRLGSPGPCGQRDSCQPGRCIISCLRQISCSGISCHQRL